MKHGSKCDCGMCSLGKKVGMIKKGSESEQGEGKKFVCKSCGSTSLGTPGECCGAPREEVTE